ncbi:hypothetical protein VNO77_17305 [Canavalia gladiata]|uniref:Uncharacterized protein n=1 Tax=Canavalia gladiata TaxID=3824 RepID=A0AAN9LNK7_CANGL
MRYGTSSGRWPWKNLQCESVEFVDSFLLLGNNESVGDLGKFLDPDSLGSLSAIAYIYEDTKGQTGEKISLTSQNTLTWFTAILYDNPLAKSVQTMLYLFPIQDGSCSK